MRFSTRRFDRRHPWGGRTRGLSAWGRATRAAQRSTLDALDAAASRSQHMMDSAAATRRGTRKRSLGMMLGGVAALVGMFSLVSQSALAVNFTSTNQAYKIYTDKVSGANAAGYLNVQDVHGDQDDPVAQIGFKTATLDGMCAIAHQSVLGFGDISLVMTAGEPVDGTVTQPAGQRISANQLYLAAEALRGNGDQVAKLTLGQSADTLAMGDIPFQGQAGAFGLQAETMNVSGLDADTYGIDLQGQINLPNLELKVVPGAKTKADCAS